MTKEKSGLPTPHPQQAALRKMKSPAKSYNEQSAKSSQNRADKIAERERQMPKIHRANYRAAVSGKSRKAAVKAFCLECVQWEKEEVRLCTALACPLYPYRPYHAQKSSNEGDNRTGFGRGPKK